jgi:hypothetical protein
MCLLGCTLMGQMADYSSSKVSTGRKKVTGSRILWNLTTKHQHVDGFENTISRVGGGPRYYGYITLYSRSTIMQLQWFEGGRQPGSQPLRGRRGRTVIDRA